MIDIIRSNKVIFLPLILSLLFFIRKGIQYALIGSYIPVIVSIIFVVSLILTFNSRKSTFFLVSKIWGIVVIIWAMARVFISVMNNITAVFDEYHLSTQFGILGLLVSAIMVLFGIILVKNSKSEKIKDWL
ncbi:MAG: hypothetical protein AAFX55_19910 [Bacteroidota bacterium]